ncbi:F-box domain-containing protein [Mycena indigotica]|uniref:F-box domain-containing protein n=1 Tax=Mycena indigotica TaxID=2126181 RepID=A0A8H6SA67_9AGAR|nr:F-box domain-containing protein [Mycena indigotica]KAF7295693.1 F-box domain-containing protein [Mycena indigotica]
MGKDTPPVPLPEGQNTSILTLPTEILIQIFLYYIPIYPECPPLFGRHSPSILTNVCRWWRTTALDMPKLWRAIHVDLTLSDKPTNLYQKGIVETARTWLVRSGGSPISVSLTCHQIHAIDAQDLNMPATEILLMECARWEYAIMRLPSHLSKKLYLKQRFMPLLVAMRLTSVGITSEQALGQIHAPRLHTFDSRLSQDLHYFKLFSSDVWSHLTTLKLRDIPLDSAWPILQGTPALRHCWLELWTPGRGINDYTGTILRVLLHLETLIVTSPTTILPPCEPFLRGFVLPSLRRFAIRLALMSDLDPPGSLTDPLGIELLVHVLQCWMCELQVLSILKLPLDGTLDQPIQEAFQNIAYLELNRSNNAWYPNPEFWGVDWFS